MSIDLIVNFTYIYWIEAFLDPISTHLKPSFLSYQIINNCWPGPGTVEQPTIETGNESR